jgi:BirA family transcriptional regulator, biotin operon repressor / biotin---[acetyl-CoA-carboxylase] ligase
MSKLFKSKEIIKLQKVDSTNTYLSGLSTQLTEGSIVWALDQTKGRGQGENKWESEPDKNLMFSIVLYPNFIKANQQFYLSKIIALAVSDLISLYTDRVSIKWPNDIYVGEKKITGILIENSIEGDSIKQTIAGIGINVNQTNFTLAPNATSLTLLTGENFDIEEVLIMLTDLIEYRYALLKNGELTTVDENYNHLLYRLNRLTTYSADGKIFEGMIQRVESTGELVIKDNMGTIRKFLHKEVEFVK